MIGPQNVVRDFLGLPLKVVSREVTPADVPFIVEVTDDYVEDVFKFCCVGSHAWVAYILSTVIVPSLHATGGVPLHLAKMVGTIVSVSGPTSQYAACDKYGDRLGDLVQQWMAKVVREDQRINR